jgi:hypothetical protein
MKGFKTYKIFINDLKKIQKFADAFIYHQIWVEIVPSQPGGSDVIVYLRQGDSQQHREMLDICIKQEVPFDIYDYKKENENG